MTTGVEPVRTCVGCRVRAPKSDLLRVVAVDGALLPDPRGTSQGRGAHLHPSLDCLAQAERRRAFPKAFRLAGPLDPAVLSAYLAQRRTTEQRDNTAQHPNQQSGTTP